MRDLVDLLYRADWTRLSLTAEVSITRDRDLWRNRFADGPPPRPWSGGQFGPWGAPWFGPPRGLADEDPSVPWQSWESPDEADPWGPRTEPKQIPAGITKPACTRSIAAANAADIGRSVTAIWL